MGSTTSYFSVRHDLLPTGTPLPYDLFVNSSALKEREKFVRVFPAGELLDAQDLEHLHSKYSQIYVSEEQRGLYLKSIVRSEGCDDTKKAEVLKDCALEYLEQIFDSKRPLSTKLLEAGIEGCREVVESMVDLLEDYDINDLRSLIGDLSFHDFYTYDHSINVSMYCISLWRLAHPGVARHELVTIGLGGLLHDLGKIKIPTKILNNPDGLTEEEYQLIKQHPDLGLELLLEGHVKVHPSLDVRVIARIIHEHHENWDGSGYPMKKSSHEIHPMARACTIVDFFDAITTKRSYNEVMPVSDGLNVMRKFRGVKLEPALFDLFESYVEHVRGDLQRDLALADHFDPTIPWSRLPLRESKAEKTLEFGRIRVVTGKPK